MYLINYAALICDDMMTGCIQKEIDTLCSFHKNDQVYAIILDNISVV
jgi:hypothetical protein